MLRSGHRLPLLLSSSTAHTRTPTQVGGDPLDTALWNPDGDEIEVSAGLLLLQECEVSGEYTLTVAGANVAYSLTLDTEDVADGTLLSNPARGTDELTVVWDPLPVNPGEADYKYEIWFVDGTPRDAPLARFCVRVKKGGGGCAWLNVKEFFFSCVSTVDLLSDFPPPPPFPHPRHTRSHRRRWH